MTQATDPVLPATAARTALRPLVVALVGNPNTGKTALFNALTGFRRHVANYPGVTVDIGRGRVRGAARPVELIDLPGTYSLAAASPDEAITCATLFGRVPEARPDVVLAIVDASNPVRNLYLLSQVLELGLPVLVALNMMDVAQARGIEIDVGTLAKQLAVPVFPVVATQSDTVAPLVRALDQPPTPGPVRRAVVKLPDAVVREVDNLAATGGLRPCEALRLLCDRGMCGERGTGRHEEVAGSVRAAQQRLADAGMDAAAVEVRARYAWIDQVLRGVVRRRLRGGGGVAAWFDRLLTHWLAGGGVLLVVLYAVFWAIYAGAAPLMEAINAGFNWLGVVVGQVVPEGLVRSLIVDGLIAGVGSVLSFLPQIALLFAFIAVLEDCGYLARAAFMVDRLMRPLGLSGRSFIPLLSSFACAVPAILGARAIGDRRERLITILIAPFMSCSARLPVYVLLISAFVPAVPLLGGWLRLDAVVMVAMYLVGVVCAVPVALLLRRTVCAGPDAGFLLELPAYRLPRLRAVAQRVYLAGRSFVVRAGTIIVLVNLIVWALAYFPRSEATRAAVLAQGAAAGWDDARTEAELAGAHLRHSLLGRMGHAIEPAIRPLGWDWRIGVGVLASFPAREVVIATFGTLLNLEDASDAHSLREGLRAMRRDDTGGPLFTLPVALSLMVFFALCAQCGSTLAVMGRETGSWVWPVVSFFGMTTLAYAAALAVSISGTALGL